MCQAIWRNRLNIKSTLLHLFQFHTLHTIHLSTDLEVENYIVQDNNYKGIYLANLHVYNNYTKFKYLQTLFNNKISGSYFQNNCLFKSIFV